jgi:hypothetical protein
VTLPTTIGAGAWIGEYLEDTTATTDLWRVTVKMLARQVRAAGAGPDAVRRRLYGSSPARAWSGGGGHCDAPRSWRQPNVGAWA